MQQKRQLLSKILDSPLIIYITWIMFLSFPLLSLIRYKLFILSSRHFIFGEHFWLILIRTPYLLALLFAIVIFRWISAYKNTTFSREKYRSLIFILVSGLLLIMIGKYLLFLESNNYPNYLYSKFGIDAGKLDFTLSICWVVLSGVVAFLIVIKKNIKHFYIMMTIFSIIIFITSAINSILGFDVYIKMASADGNSKFGGQFGYIEVTKNIPENAVVVHPPRSLKWPAVGNQAVLRYFLFPRILVDGKLIKNLGYASQFNELYFVEIEKDSPEKHWPLLDTSNKKISFDSENYIAYKSVERYKTTNGITIYKIKFQ